MASKEAVKALYEERAYAYDEKVHHKGDGWKDAIEHYDKIGKYLSIIEKDLEVLEILKKYLIVATNFNDESQWLTFDRHIFNDDIDTEADFYLIKEWLEDDIDLH